MNLSPDPNASELLDVFFAESAEGTPPRNEWGGLALEKNPNDPEQLRHVRRAVHTLKERFGDVRLSRARASWHMHSKMFLLRNW